MPSIEPLIDQKKKAEESKAHARHSLDNLEEELAEEQRRDEQKSFIMGASDKKKEDEYDDDFDEEINEDLPDPVEHSLDAIGHSGDKANVSKGMGSSGGVGVSQSLGVDPSVDSLALDDYDHVEPVD